MLKSPFTHVKHFQGGTMRKATARLTLRFTPGQLEQVHEAIRWTDEPWRGISFYVRRVILEWAGMRHVARQAAKKKKRVAA